MGHCVLHICTNHCCIILCYCPRGVKSRHQYNNDNNNYNNYNNGRFARDLYRNVYVSIDRYYDIIYV